MCHVHWLLFVIFAAFFFSTSGHVNLSLALPAFFSFVLQDILCFILWPSTFAAWIWCSNAISLNWWEKNIKKKSAQPRDRSKHGPPACCFVCLLFLLLLVLVTKKNLLWPSFHIPIIIFFFLKKKRKPPAMHIIRPLPRPTSSLLLLLLFLLLPRCRQKKTLARR